MDALYMLCRIGSYFYFDIGGNSDEENIINSIDDNGVINTQTKEKLAQVVRNHYKSNPDALKYQASGTVIPNTVNNHIK